MTQLEFDTTQFQPKTVTLDGQTVSYQAACDIPYVAKPVDDIQKLNIFVPAAYFEGGTMNGYTATSAPIFMPNTVGGYMPGPRDYPGNQQHPTNSKTLIQALRRGYVVVSAGLRGWSQQNAQGDFIGKAPAFIVDMKAAIRYVKANQGRFPGNTDRIITNGTSAGGATSALVGASGNAKFFEPALAKLGAAPATDDIFAVSAYCPIHNLEHADMAYEWEFNGINDWHRYQMDFSGDQPKFTPWAGTLTVDQQAQSAVLKAQFATYLNSLQLTDTAGAPLTLAADGNGSFRELVRQAVIASAQTALDQGVDIHKYAGFTVANGRVTSLDLSAYFDSITRMKGVPAFDELDLSSPETKLFGDAQTPAKHFTTFASEHSTVPAKLASYELVTNVNPVTYLLHNQSTRAPHWRVRHGAADRDTSFAIPLILVTLLQNRGLDVDFALPWDTPHSGDYDLGELFTWIDQLCQG